MVNSTSSITINSYSFSIADSFYSQQYFTNWNLITILIGSALGETCPSILPRSMTLHDKSTLLQLHNKIRQNPYLDRTTTTTSLLLTWDDELAKSAQRWAEQCSNKTDLCRNDGRFYVTQRFDVFITNIGSPQGEPTLRTTVDYWYRKDYEGRMYTLNSGLSQHPPDYSFEHVQKIWGKATQLGCGYLRVKDEIRNYLYIACNYAPSNNPQLV